MIVLRFVRLRSGAATPFDGQYLKDYDPSKCVVAPTGEALPWVVLTPELADAKQFEGRVEVQGVANSLRHMEFSALQSGDDGEVRPRSSPYDAFAKGAS